MTLWIIFTVALTLAWLCGLWTAAVVQSIEDCGWSKRRWKRALRSHCRRVIADGYIAPTSAGYRPKARTRKRERVA